jgi:hypothetical protein
VRGDSAQLDDARRESATEAGSVDSLERSCVRWGLVAVAVPLSLLVLNGTLTSCRSEVWGRARVEVR